MRRSSLSLIIAVTTVGFFVAWFVPGTAVAQAPEGEPSEPPAADPPPSPVADPGGGMPALPPPSAIEPEPPRGAEPEVAPADRPPPEGLRLMLSDLTVLRLNPLGLETRARFGFQKRLYASDKAITRNNFAFGGLYPKLNPASAHLGLGGEIQPASIFNLRAFGEVQKYFGTFGMLQSFQTANANYSDQTLKDLRDSSTTPPQTATVLHASIQPLLQLKFGNIAVRGLFQFDYWAFKVRPGDNVAYEATFDTLLPDNGWTLSIDADVLYTGRKNTAIGLRYSHVRPFYRDEHFANAAEHEAYDGENMHDRLGLFAAYTLADAGPSTFNKPTVILIASWYIQHRWRTGEPGTLASGNRSEDYTSRAFPYLLVGFAFESDLLATN
ncbi:MAG: hypothetical protein H0T42_20050 [Deltaproteobacteria bacterium]|nr:hypothetical protein [Deltaproteobacteria bacterium]